MGVVIYGGLECAIPIPEQHAYAVPFLVPNSQVNLFLVSGEKPCRNRLGLLPDFVRFADSKCAVTVAEHDGHPRRVARAGNRGVQLAVIIEVPHGDCVAGHVKGERRRDRGPSVPSPLPGKTSRQLQPTPSSATTSVCPLTVKSPEATMIASGPVG